MHNLIIDDRSEVEEKLLAMAEDGIISPEIIWARDRIWDVRLHSWTNNDGLADSVREYGFEYLGQAPNKTYPLIVNVAVQSRLNVIRFHSPHYQNGKG